MPTLKDLMYGGEYPRPTWLPKLQSDTYGEKMYYSVPDYIKQKMHPNRGVPWEPETSYYPNQSYIDRNLAPEKVPIGSLRELARAQQAAVKNGYLSPQVAEMFLPNILAEGRLGSNQRESDFGNNGMYYPPSKDMDSRFARMGLRVTDDPASILNNKADVYRDVNGDPKYPAGYRVDAEHTDPRVSARFSALMLAQKAKIYGDDMAIERWNGQGPDARRHAQKVITLRQMLDNPKNKDIRDAYAQMLNESD